MHWNYFEWSCIGISDYMHITYYNLRASNVRKQMILARHIILYYLPFYGIVHIQTNWLAGNVTFTCGGRGYAGENFKITSF